MPKKSTSRRRFISTALTLPLLTNMADAQEKSKDTRITRIVHCMIRSKRPKLVGNNSRGGIHGDGANDVFIRIFTNSGHEGFGFGRLKKDAAQSLLGKNPLDLLDQKARRGSGPFGTGTTAIWDLVGQITGKPVHQLLGGNGAKQVPVYDGSIYFADLLPDQAARWKDRFREEIDMGFKAGHKAFKVKVGRGSKWMERKAGDVRDIEVLRTIRNHAGRDVLIGIDANNGYDLAGAKRLLGEVGDLNLAFAEEMFPETVEHCLEFKAFLRDNKIKTLVADGESHKDASTFKPFVKARAIEILQGDMKRFGFEGILEEAALAATENLLVAPHNWGSLLGYYMQLQVGRAIPNFYRAEHDPLSSPVILADGYSRKDGIATVPDSPGCGLRIDETAFASHAKVFYDLKK